MEKKSLFVPLELKFEDQTSDRGRFKGHGAVFNNVDLGNDVIKPGAFAKTLNAWREKKMLPQMLWNHNGEEIIGEWTEMKEDEKGLYVEGKLWINGESKLEKAQQAYNVLKSNSVKGLSIGYYPTQKSLQENYDGTIIRNLEEIELLEVSVAPWAMNPEASVTGVKSKTDSEGETPSIRVAEKGLRELGFSKKQAQAILAGGYNTIKRDADNVEEVKDRDGSSDDQGLLESLKQFQTTLRG